MIAYTGNALVRLMGRLRSKEVAQECYCVCTMPFTIHERRLDAMCSGVLRKVLLEYETR